MIKSFAYLDIDFPRDKGHSSRQKRPCSAGTQSFATRDYACSSVRDHRQKKVYRCLDECGVRASAAVSKRKLILGEKVDRERKKREAKGGEKQEKKRGESARKKEKERDRPPWHDNAAA